MARALLIDPIHVHAARITVALEEQGHDVTRRAPEEVSESLEQSLLQFDLVIVNLTLDRPEDWSLLRRICRYKPMDCLCMRVLAVCSVYRGPQPKLKAERLGCRWVYDEQGYSGPRRD